VFIGGASLFTVEAKTNAMPIKYEDNFGFYFVDDNDPEELEFFCHIRAQSEPTACARCHQGVRLLKHVKLCASCSEALEFGEPSVPSWVVPNLWPVGE
jgi:hypothetical protein